MTTCCDNPKPRILETNGRMFCASCRKYLDEPAYPPSDPRSEAAPDEGRDTPPPREEDPE